MPEAGLRARVERLLRGDFHLHDLITLFLYARDRCDGRESVQEVGDFIAHSSERTKGILTRQTRDWYITAWFHSLVVQGGLNAAQLPPTFPEFLNASFRRLDRQTIRRET